MSGDAGGEADRYAYVIAHATAHATAQATAQAKARAQANAYAVRQLRPRRSARDWLSVGVSVALHGLAIVLAVALTRQRAQPEEKRTMQVSPVQPPPMRFISLPPLPRPAPAPAAKPTAERPRRLATGGQGASATPTPPARQSDRPEEHPNALPDQTPRIAARDAPRPAEEAPKPTEPDPPKPSAPEATDAPSPLHISAPTALESEAERIFGRKATPLDPSLAAGSIRPFESRDPMRQGTCSVPLPKPDPSGQPPKGTVVGRIVSEDTHRPLRGALLELVGTAYTATTDNRGEFLLFFDRSLVDLCRPQWVRVHANGYRSMLLPLTIGNEMVPVPLSRE
jgi:hypothetical protein